MPGLFWNALLLLSKNFIIQEQMEDMSIIRTDAASVSLLGRRITFTNVKTDGI